MQVTEDEKESYEFGKLKKFLSLVNFMMQDTVLNLCKESVDEFVTFMLSFVPEETRISSAAIVVNKFDKSKLNTEEESDDDLKIEGSELEGVKETKMFINKMFAKNKDPEPLFQLDLILKARALIPQYSNNPKDIVQKVKDIFEAGVKCLQDIPHLEPILLRQLFKTHVTKTIKTPVIPPEKPKIPDPNDKKALLDENTWLWEAYEKLILEMERAIAPLDEYVKTYAAFEEENSLDPDKYVAALDENPEQPITPQQLKADIMEQRQKEEELLKKIPDAINVSMFMINCKDIRNFYATKYQQIVEKEKKLIAQKVKDRTNNLTATFRMMEDRINKPPKTIEELTDTKNYINDCGAEIEKRKKEIDECMDTYKILEEFEFELSTTDSNAKWELFGAPQRLSGIMESQSLALDKLKEQMIKEMELEQEEFLEHINNLELTVNGFDSNKILAKYEDVAKAVDNIDQKMQECQEMAKTFNSREYLVGIKTTDYSQFSKLQKDFLPFSNLWKTARTWYNSHNKWMNNAWEELDANELENTFESC